MWPHPHIPCPFATVRPATARCLATGAPECTRSQISLAVSSRMRPEPLAPWEGPFRTTSLRHPEKKRGAACASPRAGRAARAHTTPTRLEGTPRMEDGQMRGLVATLRPNPPGEGCERDAPMSTCGVCGLWEMALGGVGLPCTWGTSAGTPTLILEPCGTSTRHQRSIVRRIMGTCGSWGG